jgi:hypothetical protein
MGMLPLLVSEIRRPNYLSLRSGLTQIKKRKEIITNKRLAWMGRKISVAVGERMSAARVRGGIGHTAESAAQPGDLLSAVSRG